MDIAINLHYCKTVVSKSALFNFSKLINYSVCLCFILIFYIMLQYLPTYISLFGSISAITIAFLVLLYDSSKRKLDSAKENVTNEIENFFNCSHTKKLNLFKSEDNTFLQNIILADCQCGRIDEESLNRVLEILSSTITHFNSTDTNKVDADHLRKYHFDDISNERMIYNNNKQYFKNFPKKPSLQLEFLSFLP